MHHTRQGLDERHRALEELRRRSIGSEQPSACRVCFTLHNEDVGCVCGRNEWTVLGIVVIELALLLEALHRERAACTVGDGCPVCVQQAA